MITDTTTATTTTSTCAGTTIVMRNKLVSSLPSTSNNEMIPKSLLLEPSIVETGELTLKKIQPRILMKTKQSSMEQSAGEHAMEVVTNARMKSKLLLPAGGSDDDAGGSDGDAGCGTEVELNKGTMMNTTGVVVRQYDSSDIDIRWKVGSGAFCDVYKVALIHKRYPYNNDTVRNNTGKEEEDDDDDDDERYYALKCLSPSKTGTEKLFVGAACDIAMEAHILSLLGGHGYGHPNVIKLHGVSSGEICDAYRVHEKGYFLILDLLKDTLYERLRHLRKQHQKSTSKKNRLLRSMFTNSTTDTSNDLLSSNMIFDRIKSIGMSIAEGVNYCHSKNIVIRDLKPENIGFAYDGTLKLFDFGFAREVHLVHEETNSGSLRYMPREVALGECCSLESDVYAFGLILYEICTLERPYNQFTTTYEFRDHVIINNWRHDVDTIPSPSVQVLIQQCWDEDYTKRPNFNKILPTLQMAIVCHENQPTPPTASTSTTRSKTTGFIRPTLTRLKRQESCPLPSSTTKTTASLFHTPAGDPDDPVATIEEEKTPPPSNDASVNSSTTNTTRFRRLLSFRKQKRHTFVGKHQRSISVPILPIHSSSSSSSNDSDGGGIEVDEVRSVTNSMTCTDEEFEC